MHDVSVCTVNVSILHTSIQAFLFYTKRKTFVILLNFTNKHECVTEFSNTLLTICKQSKTSHYF